MEIPTCGSFQGTCTSTSQCATNECVNGFCAGSVLPFPGAQCTPVAVNATALSCAFGASCYAVNSMEITVCGNFQAECTWDGQCAYNHCQGGFCAGALLSSSTSISASSTAPYYPTNSSQTISVSPATGTGLATTTGPGGAAPTTSILYVNGTATASNARVTSTLVVGGKTSVAGGGQTSSSQGSTQTASVQSSGACQEAGSALGGAWGLVMVGAFMLML